MTAAVQTRWRRHAQRTLRIEARAVAAQGAHVDKAFLEAAQALASCRGRVVVMGVGKSGLIGRKIAATLSSTGTPAFFVHPTEAQHGDLGMISSGDLVLALSNSGETQELRGMVRPLKGRGVPLIVMTGRARSPLAREARWVIRTAVREEACPYNVAPTASTTALLAMGDALALVVMGMKGFGPEDFARLHPGGQLGKRLTWTVEDLMHSGAENPVISENRTVAEALKLMTQTRLGAASVVDEAGRLTGVFTDGDLRRGLQKDPLLLSRPLGQVMTRRPRTVAPTTLAMEVAPLFGQLGLDNFPVVDGRGKPLGIIDEKDFLDEGLA